MPLSLTAQFYGISISHAQFFNQFAECSDPDDGAGWKSKVSLSEWATLEQISANYSTRLTIWKICRFGHCLRSNIGSNRGLNLDSRLNRIGKLWTNRGILDKSWTNFTSYYICLYFEYVSFLSFERNNVPLCYAFLSIVPRCYWSQKLSLSFRLTFET